MKKIKLLILAITILPLLMLSHFSWYWCEVKDAMLRKMIEELS